MRRAVEAELVRRFLRELGRRATKPARVYLTGGASAVLLGWRSSTLDLDLSFRPDHDELFAALPRLKEELSINIELAAPPDFVPELPGWEGRCLPVATEGPLHAFHFDFFSQLLSKVERGHVQDLEDVRRMLEDGLVDPVEMRRLFASVESQLDHYPAIDPPSLRRALEDALRGYEGGAPASGG